VAETVDFQRVLPHTQCLNVYKPMFSDFFSPAVPYAPRFLLFPPGPSDIAFPHPVVPNVTVSVINSTTADLLSNDNPIGTIELIQPEAENPEDGAILIEDGAGLVRDAGSLGGSAFVVPIQTGSVLGVYAVRVTMLDGDVAESRTAVVKSMLPTEPPTSLPTHSPTTAPTNGPTSVPTQLPTRSPTLRPTTVPTNGPTSVPTQLPTSNQILRLMVAPTNSPNSVPKQASARDYRQAKIGLAIVGAVLLAGFVLYKLFL
jgi:hypothetical protein